VVPIPPISPTDYSLKDSFEWTKLFRSFLNKPIWSNTQRSTFTRRCFGREIYVDNATGIARTCFWRHRIYSPFFKAPKINNWSPLNPIMSAFKDNPNICLVCSTIRRQADLFARWGTTHLTSPQAWRRLLLEDSYCHPLSNCSCGYLLGYP